MGELLDQNEMDQLLSAITLDDSCGVLDTNRIPPMSHQFLNQGFRAFDFKHPKKISNRECRELSISFEQIKNELAEFIFTKWGIHVKSHIQGVYSIPAEEFFRETSGGCPVIAFDWLSGSGIFTMDKKLFYRGFLNSFKKGNMNGLEKSIFCNQIYLPLIKVICNEISKESSVVQKDIENHRIIRNVNSFLKVPDFGGMGVNISIYIETEDGEGSVNLFFDGDVIETLRQHNFFKCHGESNYFSLANPEPNTIVEAGRFRLEENFDLKPGMVFKLNKLAGEPLEVIKNGKTVAIGEGYLIDDNIGIKIFDAVEEENTEPADRFFNAKVIFGQCKTADNEEYWEGKILELNEYEDEKAKIVIGNKVIALGEFCVLDENICVKITKVLKNCA